MVELDFNSFSSAGSPQSVIEVPEVLANDKDNVEGNIHECLLCEYVCVFKVMLNILSPFPLNKDHFGK